MAGRARTQALKAELQRLTIDYFDIDPVDVAIGSQTMPSHLDYVCAQVESGVSTTKQAENLKDALGFDVSYERLIAYLREEHGKEAVDAALRSARSRASHCLAESALDLVDAPQTDSVGVQRARNRAHSRHWLAERYNPEAFGQSKGVNVSISVTQLHLQALQATPNTVTGSITSAQQPLDTTRALPIQVVEQQQLNG